MKSNRTLMIVFLGSVFLFLGCEKSEPKPETTAQPQAAATENKPADPNASTPANVAPAAAPAIADSDLVTSADFEEQAEKDITAKNYKGELSSLESEIAKE